MRPWIGGGTEVWPDGAASWQVYILPDLELDDELEGLLDAYAPVVGSAEFTDCLAPVALADLHMTVQPLSGWAADYNSEQVEAVVRALEIELSETAPIEATVGPALAGSSGVLLDVAPTGEQAALTTLYDRVRQAVAGVLGEQGLGRAGWPPHVGLAYATGQRDSGDVQSRLRRVRPGRAPWRIDSVYLCDVRQDAELHRYHWRTARRVPLGGAPA